ncbi:MAG: DUF6249 domain-containing protein [Caulobacteraceae bacterium]
MWTGTIVPIIFFIWLGAVIIVPVWLKSRDRARMHETLRTAYEKGQPVPPELIAALQQSSPPWSGAGSAPTAEHDLRRGLVLVAVGLGLCAVGWGLWFGLWNASAIAANITGGVVAGVGAIPGLIGVAYLILWATKRKQSAPS